MCPCNPNDNVINVDPSPGIPIPGFGLPISPIQLPIPGFTFPDGFPEDVLDLINSLSIPFPGGTLKPNVDDLTNSILKALASLFNQIAPFLSIYNFFQAFLNMILCVLDVICAIPNPFKMRRAIKRLFKRCLPAFLNLMPWLALIAMIIALLILILALVNYIISRIEQLIEDLLANIEILSSGLSLQDDESVVAAVRKIASLLCLIEDLLAIFVAIGAIIDIINILASITGRSVCGSGGGSELDCCGPDVCPPFISNSPNGLVGFNGELIYYRAVEADTASYGIPHGIFNLTPNRSESWQFINTSTTDQFYFSDIITPIDDGDIFYPEGVTFDKNTTAKKAPYTLDMTLKDFDVSVFHNGDTGGIRNFVIKDVIVSKKPYIGVVNFENVLDSAINSSGTLSLAGGLVYEEDGTTPYIIDSSQATIETFIHRDSYLGLVPSFDDGYYTSNIEFTLNIHHDVLLSYALITLGCEPSVAQERVFANTRAETVGIDAIVNRLPHISAAGFLPDIAGAHKCASDSIAKLRADVSQSSVATFQSEISVCLNNLKNETEASLKNLIIAAVSIFDSTIELDTDLQFVTRPITVSVKLKDVNGTVISTNIPSDISQSIADLLDGYVTFGELSKFSYDGYDSFISLLTSDIAGSGDLTVAFNNNTFKKILNTDDDNTPTVMENNVLSYKFISTHPVAKDSGSMESDAKPRRDERDISGNRT